MLAARLDPLALPAVPPPADDTHPWRDRILLVGFVAALACSGLALISTASRTAMPHENRLATAWPKVGVSGFTAAFERALADRFGGRDALVSLHHHIKAWVLKVSPVPTVVLGRNGWLYFDGKTAANPGGTTPVASQPNRAPAATANPQQIVAGIAARRQYLADRGIGYLLVVVPDKQTVYPEHLRAPETGLVAPSRLDTVVTGLDAADRTHVLDLRPPLLAAKQTRQVYYRTDSHWNGSGGWVAYRAILAAIHRQMGLPELQVLPLPPTQVTAQVSGDLARMLGIQHGFVEPNHVLVPAPGANACAKNTAGGPPEWGAAQQTLKCPTARLGKVAVYHDSMGLELLPLLPNEWQESVWASRRVWDLKALNQQTPAMLIDLVVERSLPLLADVSFLPGAGGAAAPALPPAQGWQPGTPAGFEFSAHHSSPATGMVACTVDLVSGAPASGTTTMESGSDQPLLIEGWAAKVADAQLPGVAWLALRASERSFYVPVELRRARPDVAAALSKPALVTAGYRVNAQMTNLPAGRYEIYVLSTWATGPASCSTGKSLNLS